MAEPVLSWNGEDCRAFVPPVALVETISVVRSTPADLLQSPGPFSVGVYVCGDSSDPAFRPLSLFYVSQHVAEDRAKDAPPMPPGWYMPVSKDELGRRFEVRLTTCKEILASVGEDEMEGFDRARVSLLAGGVNANRPKAFDFSKGAKWNGTAFFMTDRRWRGHCPRSTTSSISSGKDLISSFTFSESAVRESAAGEDIEPQNDIGVLEIATKKAMVGPSRPDEVPPSSSNAKIAVMVTEKEVMKNGLGVSLAGDGKMIAVDRYKKRVTSRNKLTVHSLGLKIYVRDLSWLVRRRIVDSKGRAWREVAPESEVMKVKKPLARAAADSSSDKPPKIARTDTHASIDSIDLTSE